ncbi:MAG: CopD family protein [gamma proteobacterium endosymbiont of Lamellibrachia anaximandri]|nr:CopD family protein [gamma proteobacterium endosymbiont of Lamellibrachia anaximandri]MBL3533101.1 CopD family protein [gamma proteobacterium endosymbiont of Lamellibrachia anaximandri]
MSLAMTLHLLAAIVWVGGMFFAHMALRPAAAQLLDPPQRLPLLLKVFDGFFPWVWLAVILILVTGSWVLFSVFNGAATTSVWIMTLVGTLMAAIFVFIYAVPYHRMSEALQAGELPKAGEAMALIRKLIGTNLILGLSVTTLAVAGKYSGF